MTDSAQDRTEKATPKRLREARAKGQLPRSRELNTAVVVLAIAVAVSTQGVALAEGAAALLQEYLRALPAALVAPGEGLRLAGGLFGRALWLMAPVFAVGFAAALIAPMMLGGWNLSSKALQFDLSRANPLAGFKRLFSANSLVELGKALLKVIVLGVIAVVVFMDQREVWLALPSLPLPAALAGGARAMVEGLRWMGGGLLLIAAVDVPWQLWHHAQQLRMTKQEVREEFQQSEGKPEVKSRIRRVQQEFSRGRMMEAVPKADVIVTNPTHYAVALQYQQGKDRAPRVVAKGVDVIAQQIRELARQHRVPLVEAPPLARALYRSCELEAEIPGPLYQAVAQVLSYVYQLRDIGRGDKPAPPKIAEDLPNGQPDAS